MGEKFIPSTEQLLHWIYEGTEGCRCTEICIKMIRLSDEDN